MANIVWIVQNLAQREYFDSNLQGTFKVFVKRKSSILLK